jgi:hypothetical protein
MALLDRATGAERHQNQKRIKIMQHADCQVLPTAD